ncbi:hypothetical protein THAOC_11425, partial [Thalassiosira oceanica]
QGDRAIHEEIYLKVMNVNIVVSWDHKYAPQLDANHSPLPMNLPQTPSSREFAWKAATQKKDEVAVAGSLPRPRPLRQNGEILHAPFRPPPRTITRPVRAVRPGSPPAVPVPSQAVSAPDRRGDLPISALTAE